MLQPESYFIQNYIINQLHLSLFLQTCAMFNTQSIYWTRRHHLEMTRAYVIDIPAPTSPAAAPAPIFPN